MMNHQFRLFYYLKRKLNPRANGLNTVAAIFKYKCNRLFNLRRNNNSYGKFQ